MSVLITGGAGFIGAYVARVLLGSDRRVITLDPLPSNVIHTVLTPEEISRISFERGDVSSLRDLAHVIQKHGVERVIHLASLLHPACSENPPLAIRVNIQGQTNVLEAARLFGLKKVVWASSAVVFGSRQFHPERPLPDDAPHHPANLYGATKSFDEHLTADYIRRWGIDALGLRFTVVYGPGRIRGASAFVNELVKPALGEAANVPFGDDVVDWQYVEDVAHLLVRCVDSPRTVRAVFNTQFDRRSVREAGEYVKRLIPSARITYQPGEFGVAWELDDTALQEEIGFRPAFRMEDGMRRLIDHARTQAGLPPLNSTTGDGSKGDEG
ncbi:NAD-dependent epimerase/dehydratase family protein [Rubrobacter calidifluminis]|uniref:NAD-dependent epimerase/dehydratase family protein n=1 Tax=Rubrobacter calidifluminis TaxID=1392640 RepID=UPI0023625872|nr:NAD(P)-dependent oxidoreductase [Rubrobacter calidifluminis]